VNLSNKKFLESRAAIAPGRWATKQLFCHLGLLARSSVITKPFWAGRTETDDRWVASLKTKGPEQREEIRTPDPLVINPMNAGFLQTSKLLFLRIQNTM
jgi:hypothetical protein